MGRTTAITIREFYDPPTEENYDYPKIEIPEEENKNSAHILENTLNIEKYMLDKIEDGVTTSINALKIYKR